MARDLKGNLWYGNMFLEPSPIHPPIDDNHFWCIVCNAVQPISIKGGMRCDVKFGGWVCRSHLLKAKNLLAEMTAVLR